MSRVNSVAVLTSLVLAFVGPLCVALATRPLAAAHPITAQMLGVAAIAGLVAAVLVITAYWQGLALGAIGLKAPSWAGFGLGLLLAAIFVLLIGPLLMKMPDWLGLEGFETGLASTAAMPGWLLVLSILIIGSSEEVLYRGYAIPQLGALTGRTLLAVAVTTLAFALVHLPLWGPGPAATTLVSRRCIRRRLCLAARPFPAHHCASGDDLAGLALPRLTSSS